MWVMSRHIRIMALIVLAALVGACAQSTANAHLTPTITPIKTTTATVTAQPTIPAPAGGGTTLPSPTSLPSAGSLGATPLNCPAISPLTTVSGAGFGMAAGVEPVWVSGFSGTQASLHLGSAATHGQYGWQGTLTWNVRLPTPGPVVVQGFPQGGGAPLWFQVGTQAATTEPDLLHTQPGSGSSASWDAFTTTIAVPQAGCYTLNAMWHDGSAKILLAIGQ